MTRRAAAWPRAQRRGSTCGATTRRCGGALRAAAAGRRRSPLAGLADAAFFYLQRPSILVAGLDPHLRPRAMADYHYYYGHVMWDIETFAVPPLLLLEPAAVRALLDYRFRSVRRPSSNARLDGYRGPHVPVEGSPGAGRRGGSDVELGADRRTPCRLSASPMPSRSTRTPAGTTTTWPDTLAVGTRRPGWRAASKWTCCGRRDPADHGRRRAAASDREQRVRATSRRRRPPRGARHRRRVGAANPRVVDTDR